MFSFTLKENIFGSFQVFSLFRLASVSCFYDASTSSGQYQSRGNFHCGGQNWLILVGTHYDTQVRRTVTPFTTSKPCTGRAHVSSFRIKLRSSISVLMVKTYRHKHVQDRGCAHVASRDHKREQCCRCHCYHCGYCYHHSYNSSYFFSENLWWNFVSSYIQAKC